MTAITIKDIAGLANVSHTTVSRCLNNSPLISEKTKNRVIRIAKDLHYEANNSARSLSTKKTGIVGVIYQRELEDSGSSAYTNELFLELRYNLETWQIDTILLEAINPNTLASNTIRLIRQQKVDGFLMIHRQISPDDIRYINEHRIPVVQIHFKPDNIDLHTMDSYLTNHVRGGYLATQHLIDRGCRKILTLECSPAVGDEFENRTAGFYQALNEKGIPVDRGSVYKLPCTYLSAYRFIHEHIDLIKSYDGIFAQADILASACIAALKEHRICVPRDIRVVGYDDSFYSTLAPPFITTIHQPRERITAEACKRIQYLIKTDPVDISAREHRSIDPCLVIRETT